jgi:hypothetical protein
VSFRPLPRIRRTAPAVVLTGIGLLAVFPQPSSAQKVVKDLAAYIKQADALCGASNATLASAAKLVETAVARSTVGGRIRSVKIAVPAGAEKYITATAVPALTKLSKDLRAISVPDGQGAVIGDLLTSFDKGLATLKAKPRESVFNDPMKTSAKAFVEAGFEACGHSVTQPAKK